MITTRRLSRPKPGRATAMAVIALLVASTVAVVAPRPASAAPGFWNRIEFWKDTDINSDLTAVTNGTPSWTRRAGSGATANPCQSFQGWLPCGWYDVRAGSGYVGHRDDYNGGAIFGRVWHLENKQCSNGTWRTELFIHTEESPTRTQVNCGPPHDSPQCWEGVNDFYSQACIKVARGPVGAATTNQLNQWWASVGGATNTTYVDAVWVSG